MKNETYYSDQLDQRLEDDKANEFTVQIRGTNGNTKWLRLNNGSIEDFKNFLDNVSALLK